MARTKNSASKKPAAKNAAPAHEPANAKAAPAKAAQAAAGKPASKRSDARAPSADEIRRRAFEIWRSRGGAPGSPEDDWRQAERELTGARG